MCSSSCAAGEEDRNTKVVKGAVVFWKPLGDAFCNCYLKSMLMTASEFAIDLRRVWLQLNPGADK